MTYLNTDYTQQHTAVDITYEISSERMYYHQALELIIKSETLPVEVIYTVGGRWSGKTFDTVLFAVSASTVQDVAVYAWRESVQNAQELFNEIYQTLEDTGMLQYWTINKTQKKFSHRHRHSFIQVGGLTTRNGRQAKTGLARAGLNKYIINIFEEAYEFGKHQVQAAKEAVRGTAAVLIGELEIHIANPWDITNYFIGLMNDAMPFDKNLLEQHGQQYRFDKDDKTIYHWVNHRINPQHQTPKRLNDIKRAWKLDPQRAKIIDLGMPGILSGLIYASTYAKAMTPNFNTNARYDATGGADIGWGTSKEAGATTAYFILHNRMGSEVREEYYHSNAEQQTTVFGKTHDTGHKDAHDLAQEMHNFYTMCLKKYLIRGRLTISVDNAEWAFVSQLQKLSNKTPNIEYVECTKLKIKRRVRTTLSMLRVGRLRIDKRACPMLDKDLRTIEWLQPEGTVKKKPEPIRNPVKTHTLDGMEYGLVNQMDEFLLSNDTSMLKW